MDAQGFGTRASIAIRAEPCQSPQPVLMAMGQAGNLAGATAECDTTRRENDKKMHDRKIENRQNADRTELPTASIGPWSRGNTRFAASWLSSFCHSFFCHLLLLLHSTRRPGQPERHATDRAQGQTRRPPPAFRCGLGWPKSNSLSCSNPLHRLRPAADQIPGHYATSLLHP